MMVVIYAYLLNTTFPLLVTRPKSDTFTSTIVPFVSTPKLVNNALYGFLFTLTISK